MKDKVCLVTGANSGLGKAISTGLAGLNARVVMVCRDRFRGEAARSEVVSATGSEQVDLIVGDLSDLQDVREIAEEFRRRHRRLDVLVNNAAVFLPERRTTPDGVEAMFATNHLGPFLLTNLLLDMLRASAPSRVLNVAALSSQPIDLDDPNGAATFDAARAYAATRTCNVLFTLELARRLQGTGVVVNGLDPGMVDSRILGTKPGVVRFAARMFAKSPEKAAEGPLRLLTDPTFAPVPGAVYVGTRPGKIDPYALDPVNQKRLWDVSARLAGLGPTGMDPIPLAKALQPAEA